MKKKFKYFLAIMLSVIMLFSFPLSASAFARKDVTKAYQKSVAKMMRNFDYYMGLGCLRNYQFKFDDYAKTTMVAIPDYKLNGQSFSYVKKKIQPQMKLYFNTTKVTFKKMNTYRYSKNPAYRMHNETPVLHRKDGHSTPSLSDSHPIEVLAQPHYTGLSRQNVPHRPVARSGRPISVSGLSPSSCLSGYSHPKKTAKF